MFVACVQFKENHKSILHKSDEEKKKNINLLDCVKLFTVEEQLGEEDPWCVAVGYCTGLCMPPYMQYARYTHIHTHTHTHTHSAHTHTRRTHHYCIAFNTYCDTLY